MLKKRVIFTLLYNSGSFMLSRNFVLQRVGDLKWLQKNYNFSKIAFSIDELIVLDVTRGERDPEAFCRHLQSLTEDCFIPIAGGGGIRTLEQARRILRSGGDKVVVNTLVGESPDVVRDIASEFGRQCVVVSVDAKQVEGRFTVWTQNGSRQEQVDLATWLLRVLELPVGEIYLNSMDRDGTGQGYLFELLEALPAPVPVPVILAGGAGKYAHLAEGLEDSRVDAVATAHLFNFVGDGLSHARRELLRTGHDLPRWDVEQARSLRGGLADGA